MWNLIELVPASITAYRWGPVPTRGLFAVTIVFSVQKNIPISFFSSSSRGIMVSTSGTIGASVAPTSRSSASRVTGAMRMSCTTPEAVAQVGQRLDVGAAHERLVGGRPAAQPLGIELAHVALGQRAVFTQARALGLR